MKFQYADGGRKAAGFRGIAGDCVCRAICNATGLEYKDVYHKLAHGNCTQRNTSRSSRGRRTASEGIHVGRTWFKEYMAKLDFVWVSTMGIGTGCKVHLRRDQLPTVGRMVVRVSKHCTAVVNGVLFDTEDCSRDGSRCVYGYWLLRE